MINVFPSLRARPDAGMWPLSAAPTPFQWARPHRHRSRRQPMALPLLRAIERVGQAG